MVITKEYFSEFTIIDTIGILLPGVVFTLIFHEVFAFLSYFQGYFTSESSVLLDGVLLICTGYCMGTVLQELSSAWEKFTWINPMLNPHLYAALKGTEFSTSEASFGWKIKDTLLVLHGVGIAVILGIIVWLVLNGIAGIIVGTITFSTQVCLYFKCKKSIGKSELHSIYGATKEILSNLKNPGKKADKVLLFRSFRTFSRNMLLVQVLTTAAVKLDIIDISWTDLIYFSDDFNNSWFLPVCWLMIAIVLYWRYVRYSYLAYQLAFASSDDG